MSSRISSLELSDSDESSVFSVPDHARPAAVPLLDSAGPLLSVNSHSPLFGTPRSSRSDEGTTGGGGRANVTLFYCQRAMSVCRVTSPRTKEFAFAVNQHQIAQL
jgi:hypothetical protein